MKRRRTKAASQAAISRFALECRKVRLIIAQNPGISSFDLRNKSGFKPDFHVMKMLGMGIIKTEGVDGPYFVVPQ
jgi:hypothetical protein